MEILTLATTALALVNPFLQKIGEGTSRKIGEDIWNLIKKPFDTKQKNIEELNPEDLKNELIEILKTDGTFKKELEEFILNVQPTTESVTQNINNNAVVEKQANIGNNIGNISL